MSTGETQQGCETCNKSGLSLLMLRASPIAKDAKLAPLGSDAVSSADAMVEGLVPARKPTESRIVLRLLRAGFVHVYIPSPPPGMKSWLVYRVTEGADLIADSNPVFVQMPQPPACSRDGHNTAGMKLLHLPQAHKLSTIWVAYSANLWSDKLKSRNAANPKAMQQISLQSRGRNAFTPTVGALRSQVLECAVASIRARGVEASATKVDQDFPFVSMAGEVQSLADNLQRAAACHPKTKGLEMAVVLRDPVGFASELNAIRLRRNELAKAEIEKPENAHPLNSSNALMGLKQVMLDANLAKSYETVSPVMSRGAFTDVMRVKPNPRGWPEGTVWEPLEISHENTARYGLGMGRVIFPDHDERAVAWARAQSAATWATMARHYKEAARADWLKKFEAGMQTAHYEPLAKFEADWWEARKDAQFNDYFGLHFDEADPNDPKRHHCPGLTYTREVTLATTPAPLTQGKVLDDYLAELNKEATEPTAVMLRAVVANQAELLPKVQAVLAVDASLALPHLHNERNDKLYDLGSGMLLGAYGASNPNAAQRLVVKYGWLSAAFGDLLGGYTILIAQSFNGALMSMAAGRGGLEFSKSAVGKRLLNRVQAVQLVQRAADLALQSVVSGGVFKTPMQITKRYPVGQAMALIAGREGVSRSQVRKASKGGYVDLTLITDNHELAKLAGDVDAAIEKGAGRIELPARPKAALLQTPATLGTLILSEAQFSRLWQDKLKLSARAAEAVRESISGGHAVIRSLDGRLALGVILINGVGLNGALNKLSSDDAKQVRDAWVGMTDSTASVIGGLLQVWEVAAKASIAHRLGDKAVQGSAGIHALRAGAAGLGAVAGVANMLGQFARAWDATEAGNEGVRWMYFGSGVAFAGTAVTSGLTFAGALADRQVAKGVASAGARRMAMRFGAQGAASLLGISVTGWGLLLLGAAVLFEVGAVMLTPTQLQEWIRRSYFGDGPEDRKFAKGDWAAEFAALEKLFSSSLDSDQPRVATERALPPAGAASAPVKAA